MEEIDSIRHRPSAVLQGVIGFSWMFTAALLVMGGGAVVVLAVGTHLLIRLRPDVTAVITYDPSTVATFAFIPILAGVALSGLYWRRLQRLPRSGG